jgi:hypothetical protein
MFEKIADSDALISLQLEVPSPFGWTGLEVGLAKGLGTQVIQVISECTEAPIPPEGFEQIRALGGPNEVDAQHVAQRITEIVEQHRLML